MYPFLMIKIYKKKKSDKKMVDLTEHFDDRSISLLTEIITNFVTLRIFPYEIYINRKKNSLTRSNYKKEISAFVSS